MYWRFGTFTGWGYYDDEDGVAGSRKDADDEQEEEILA